MDLLKDLGFKQWWHLAAAAGALIFGASIAVNMLPAIHIGMGLLLIGIGEWINHPLQEQIGVGFKITGYPRRFTFIGTLFDLVGLIFFGYGAYRLLLY